jgi:hypothetical protein
MGFLIAVVVVALCVVALLIAVPVILGSLIVAVLVAPVFALTRLVRRCRAGRRVVRRPLAWAHPHPSVRPMVDLTLVGSMGRQLEEIRRLPEASELPEGAGDL